MPELSNYEYILVEYVPSPLRETRIPVGLFLFDSAHRLVRRGFMQDMRRIHCLDPQVDLEMLSALPTHFENLLSDISTFTTESLSLYQHLQELHTESSGGLQVTLPRGVLSLDPDAEFELLAHQYIHPPRQASQSRPVREGSRPWIYSQLADAIKANALFEHLKRDIPVAEFTAPGDGFRLDFAYRPNGTTKYLHALSLERDWNQAKLLGYTFWRIQQKTSAEMTAIVNDMVGESASAHNCRQLLTDAQIRIQPLSQLASYLTGVRKELRIM